MDELVTRCRINENGIPRIDPDGEWVQYHEVQELIAHFQMMEGVLGEKIDDLIERNKGLLEEMKRNRGRKDGDY